MFTHTHVWSTWAWCDTSIRYWRTCVGCGTIAETHEGVETTEVAEHPYAALVS